MALVSTGTFEMRRTELFASVHTKQVLGVINWFPPSVLVASGKTDLGEVQWILLIWKRQVMQTEVSVIMSMTSVGVPYNVRMAVLYG